jgi:hypothetical protein
MDGNFAKLDLKWILICKARFEMENLKILQAWFEVKFNLQAWFEVEIDNLQA